MKLRESVVNTNEPPTGMARHFTDPAMYPHSENPAQNPIREWSDTPEVRDDLRLLLKRMPEGVTSLLRRLVATPRQTSTEDDLAAITLLHKHTKAFGFVNLIQVDGNECVLPDAARNPVREALPAT